MTFTQTHRPVLTEVDPPSPSLLAWTSWCQTWPVYNDDTHAGFTRREKDAPQRILFHSLVLELWIAKISPPPFFFFAFLIPRPGSSSCSSLIMVCFFLWVSLAETMNSVLDVQHDGGGGGGGLNFTWFKAWQRFRFSGIELKSAKVNGLMRHYSAQRIPSWLYFL